MDFDWLFPFLDGQIQLIYFDIMIETFMNDSMRAKEPA